MLWCACVFKLYSHVFLDWFMYVGWLWWGFCFLVSWFSAALGLPVSLFCFSLHTLPPQPSCIILAPCVFTSQSAPFLFSCSTCTSSPLQFSLYLSPGFQFSLVGSFVLHSVQFCSACTQTRIKIYSLSSCCLQSPVFGSTCSALHNIPDTQGFSAS